MANLPFIIEKILHRKDAKTQSAQNQFNWNVSNPFPYYLSFTNFAHENIKLILKHKYSL